MRIPTLCMLAAFALGAAGPDEEKAVLAAAQKLFDGMAARDADMIRATMTPDARVVLMRGDQMALNATREDFTQRIVTGKSPVLERIWAPKVQVHGRIATLWADYDVHVSGKFSHCGIDTFLMVKTDEGWKSFGLGSTMETEGCAPSPLGPPKN
jgi:hypothetical protein